MCVRRATLGLFCLLMTAGTAVAQGRGIIMPMHFYGLRPTVDVYVGDRGPYRFLIDTGAAGIARIDVSLAKQLALSQHDQVSASDAGAASKTLATVKVPMLRVGPLSFHDVIVPSRDYNAGADYLEPIAGIVGFDAFRDVLLTLDFAHGVVRIETGSLPPVDGRAILGYRLVEGQPMIPFWIGPRRFEALFDTGDSRALDFPSRWLRNLRLASYPRVIGTSSSVSGDVPLREVAIHDPVRIGTHRISEPVLTFADEFTEANIGATLLQDLVITIDQRNQRIRLVRPKQ